MKPARAEAEGRARDGWGRLAAALAAGGTLLLGIWPWGLLRWLLDAVGNI
jgi:hypothetical protein